MVSLHSERFLAEICIRGGPAEVFEALLPVLGERLVCDRIFLYLRSPHQRLGRVPFCWRRHPHIPQIYDLDWEPEPATLEVEDPLFAAALRTEPSVFVEDVETANPAVVNRAFEAQTFGHRALIHAHLSWDGRLWGILQPAVFGQPRVWSQADRALIDATLAQITPLAVEYVTNHLAAHSGMPNFYESRYHDR